MRLLKDSNHFGKEDSSWIDLHYVFSMYVLSIECYFLDFTAHGLLYVLTILTFYMRLLIMRLKGFVETTNSGN